MNDSSGRKQDNVLAALKAVTHEVTRVTNHGHINALSVCGLLAAVSARHPGRVTLVMDDARYQRCELVKGEARRLGVKLLILPGYSPHLNRVYVALEGAGAFVELVDHVGGMIAREQSLPAAWRSERSLPLGCVI